VASWHRANPRVPVGDPEPEVFGKHIRAHYHRGPGGGYLAGHRESPGWFARGCPPECGGLKPGETAEQAPGYWSG
jgi:hypothetical protein